MSYSLLDKKLLFIRGRGNASSYLIAQQDITDLAAGLHTKLLASQTDFQR